MKKRIEVYFENEDHAETAKSKLASLNTSNLMIDELPEAPGDRNMVPLVTGTASGGAGAGAMANVGGASGSGGPGVGGGFLPLQGNGLFKSDNNKSYPVVMLSVEVKEEDHFEAISLLKDIGAYIDEEELGEE